MTRGLTYIGDSHFDLPILNTYAYSGKNLPSVDIPFIKQNCAEKNCPNLLGYFSKSGKQKPEYVGAKCEKHAGSPR
jgi:hypothetical protein